MGALLDAMKKLNNGTSALSAMKRLEEAYIVVEKTMVEYDNKKKTEAKTTPTEPEALEVISIPAQQTPTPTRSPQGLK